jgi:hypothetical protein
MPCEQKIVNVYANQKKGEDEVVSIFAFHYVDGKVKKFTKDVYVYTALSGWFRFELEVLKRITGYYSRMLGVVADCAKTSEVYGPAIWSLRPGKVGFELIQPFEIDGFHLKGFPTEGKHLLKRGLVYLACTVPHVVGHILVKNIRRHMPFVPDWARTGYFNLYFCSSHATTFVVK